MIDGVARSFGKMGTATLKILENVSPENRIKPVFQVLTKALFTIFGVTLKRGMLPSVGLIDLAHVDFLAEAWSAIPVIGRRSTHE